MTDFLLELRSEEIPARMQDKARDDLARLFTAELDKAGLKASAIETYATPRRLALIARDLPLATEAVSEELKGPRAGAPPQALEGFLRKTGLTAEQLVERDGVLFAVIERAGRATADVLAEAIPAIVRVFPWPKSMRWGGASTSTESLRWVRPLHSIVALLGEDVVPCEVAGVTSSAATLGHRFHHPGVITIGSAADYAEKLRACHVIVDQDERRAIIRDRAAALASEAGLELIEDEGLVAENAGLTEWPVPLLGRFDVDYLGVPPEVIQLTARVNQKYFVCRTPLPLAGGVGGGAGMANAHPPAPSRKREGELANAFICTANIEASDGGAKIVDGNRKVLAARLSDARFFYETDLKVPLEEQAKKLEKIVFHEKLGNVADKVERVAKLARWLVEQKIVTPAKAGAYGASSTALSAEMDPSLRWGDENEAKLADQADRAARLAKADLVTGMVGEFPELQGLMGGYYAAAQGEDAAVVNAIRHQYFHDPVAPIEPVAVSIALADRLDTIENFFRINEKPTGSKDPFALRRAAIQSLLLIMRGLRLDLRKIVSDDVVDFLVDRWAVQNRYAGSDPNLIFAVRAVVGNGDLYCMGIRMRALEEFVGTEDGANLLAGYKRAANILKKEGWSSDTSSRHPGLDPGSRSPGKEEVRPRLGGRGDEGGMRVAKSLSYTPEKAEADLIAALDAAEPAAADAVGHEDFEAAMAALATLRAPIDAFFDSVTVNDPDAAKREARLALLARVRDAVHTVADFSKIEG